MSHRVVDELEERRVVRRLTSLAEAVAPLPDGELAAMLARVSSGCSRRRPAVPVRRAWHRLPGVAAAIAAGLVIAVGLGRTDDRFDRPGDHGTAPERLVSFPEGSALELLLSRAGQDRPA